MAATALLRSIRRRDVVSAPLSVYKSLAQPSWGSSSTGQNNYLCKAFELKPVVNSILGTVYNTSNVRLFSTSSGEPKKLIERGSGKEYRKRTVKNLWNSVLEEVCSVLKEIYTKLREKLVELAVIAVLVILTKQNKGGDDLETKQYSLLSSKVEKMDSELRELIWRITSRLDDLTSKHYDLRSSVYELKPKS